MTKGVGMKIRWMMAIVVWMMALGIGLLAAVAQDTSAPKGPKEKLSYALGIDLGNQLRKLSIKVDPVVFSQGLKDALSGSNPQMTEEEVRAAVSELQADVKLKQAQARKGIDDTKTEDASSLKSQKEKISYAVGMDLGNQLRKMSVDVDTAVFGHGLKDALSGGKTLMTEEQVRAAVSELQAEMKRRQASARKGTDDDKTELALLAGYNKRVGDAFLAENQKKEGVVTLPSGLQYKVLKPGEGKKPTIDDTVVCHYRGTLLDGTEFYNSYKRNQSMTFAIKGGVIKGWGEALQLMPVGSKWQLFVPPHLAYDDKGSGPIGPNATLIYEVELLSIKDRP
jgi:FKBP-type peptidyl-prolyl cis-trans isomerase